MGIDIEARLDALAELDDELSNLDAGISDMSDRDAAYNCDHQGAKDKLAISYELAEMLKNGHSRMPEKYFASRLQELKDLIAHGLANLEGFDSDA